MIKTSPFVITISRQLGSGGAFVGQQLAKHLGIFYADREIISRAAKQLVVLEEDLQSQEEKVNSFWQNFLQLCTYCSPDAYIPPQAIFPTDNELFKVESEIIKHIAAERSAVIIGRCASYILQKHPKHVSIFLHGNIESRTCRVQELYKVSDSSARNMISKSDSQRAHYHHFFTGKVWTDANQYDISIDTSKIGLDKTVELILKYLESI